MAHDWDQDGVQEGTLCPHCKKDKVVLVKADFPWTTDHLQCPRCDSTYCIGSPIEEKEAKP